MRVDPVAPHAGWALFLDVDGTLLEIAATPHDVQVSEDLARLLSELSRRLGGALALISGRSLSSIDQLFAPLLFCASGVHGCERRTAAGHTIRPEIDAQEIAAARAELTALVLEHSGLLLEDKSYGLALHYRLAPQLREWAHSTMESLLQRLGPEYVLQPGKSVLELRPARASKGTSVNAFMQEAPFRGRTPIYIGDDVTDEAAFAAVNALDGVSIRVGAPAPTAAHYRLPDVAAVQEWLQATSFTSPRLRLPARAAA
jgi:trehalose 6-phosphate phosphatase